MSNGMLDDLRGLLAQMRDADGSDRSDHLADGTRLIRAFIHLKDSGSRRQVIELAERLMPKKPDVSA